MRTIVAIGIAGALGALARYGIGGLIVGRSVRAFPWETFVVNVTGSFVLGFAFTVMTEQLTSGAWCRPPRHRGTAPVQNGTRMTWLSHSLFVHRLSLCASATFCAS